MESVLTEKELSVLGMVLQKSPISQRDLAHDTGISLGLINVILKKLTEEGHIQIKQLNKRKVEYALTPQGFLENSKNTYIYTLKTMRNFKKIEERIIQLLTDLAQSGYKYIFLHGDAEMREFLELLIKKSNGKINLTSGNEPHNDPQSLVVNVNYAPLDNHLSGVTINLFEKIGF